MTKFGYLLLVGVMIVVALVAWLWPTAKPEPLPGPTATTTTPTAPTATTKDDLISVDEPQQSASISSPLKASGKARGPWYFEASFPVKIYDGNGTLLGSAPAHALGEWTTNDYVPFSASVDFSFPSTATGTVVFEKDNPSGLPQHANALSIEVNFAHYGNFSRDGNVTKGNPGQREGVWYLTYDKPGAPGTSVELDLNSVPAPYIDLSQGERVHVEGNLVGSVVTVWSIATTSAAQP